MPSNTVPSPSEDLKLHPYLSRKRSLKRRFSRSLDKDYHLFSGLSDDEEDTLTDRPSLRRRLSGDPRIMMRSSRKQAQPQSAAAAKAKSAASNAVPKPEPVHVRLCEPNFDCKFYSEKNGLNMYGYIPASARTCVLSYLGMDVINFDNAMTNHEDRPVLTEAYHGLVLEGCVYGCTLPPFRSTGKWCFEGVNSRNSDKEKENISSSLQKGLQWAQKRGVTIRNFTLDIPGWPESHHLRGLILHTRYAMVKAILQLCETSYDFNGVEKTLNPLSVFINDGDCEIVAMLLKKPHVEVNHRDERGCTCLHTLAGGRKGGDMVETLLLSGRVDPEIGCKRDGETPLMCAAASGNVDVIKALVKHGAKVNAVNKHGHSAFDRASRVIKDTTA